MMKLLTEVLSKKLGKTILTADYQTTQLHGGTLGDVKLLTGTARDVDETEEPFSLVWKKQKMWVRPGDPNSWRREYDLYASDFYKAFFESFRMPECYYAEITDNEMQLWMEYIDGVSGSDLTIEMLEQAALELGRFQGRTWMHRGDFKGILCFGDEGFLEREFNQWHTQTFSYDFLISERCRIPNAFKQMLESGDIELIEGKSFEYSCLRSKGCDIPNHLKQMLMEIDDNRVMLFAALKTLPVVLCHRDFWNENIFFSNDQIRLIDWDTAGWGFLGEDIASLIVDGMGVERFEENYRTLVPAYLKGVSEYMGIPAIGVQLILTMTLIKFGYRMMQEYMFAGDAEEKLWGVNALQKLYEMKDGMNIVDF
ncbi:MAG: aminoglycoside phosphotransferase family protein [Clostridiaceae bacterium]|nr:aminoglycoside phosphotransferase family protein [Clostridiaceae bacterium]